MEDKGEGSIGAIMNRDCFCCKLTLVVLDNNRKTSLLFLLFLKISVKRSLTLCRTSNNCE